MTNDDATLQTSNPGEELAAIRAVKTADLFNLPEALAYVNAALVAGGGRPLTTVGFKRHLYDADGLFQMEPIRVGRRPGREGERRSERAMGVVFTRRMLDEYLANRAHNAAYGAERRVTRPTAAERAAIMSWVEARAFLNAWFERRGMAFRVSEVVFGGYRDRGRLAHKVIGKSAVYLWADLESLARDITRRLNGAALRLRAGRPTGATDRRRRTRRDPETVRREAILDWLGKTPDELRAELGEEGAAADAGTP